MTSKMCRLVCLAVAFAACGVGFVSQAIGGPYDNTPNVLMGIDAMTLKAGGIFRNAGSQGTANGDDGFNTFDFGPEANNLPLTTGYGKYDAWRFQNTAAGSCCVSHNARNHSDTPDTTDGTNTSLIPFSVTKNYLPVIDQMAFGQLFDPSQYQIQVKFKPMLQKTTADGLGTNPYPSNPTYPPISAGLENTAPLFTVGLDLTGGYVWDQSAATYKRANEGLTYNIGSTATPINTWYASAPHDADGFATFSVPVTSPSFVQRGYYYGYGSGDIRTNNVVPFGGVDGAGADVTVGFGAGFQNFGGGPADPSDPSSKLNTPNGVPLISFGNPDPPGQIGLEVKSIALTRINPGPVLARIDANSGITFRTGTGFTYGATQPAIVVDGTPLNPVATDQISRFDANGMTNLILNERTPDGANEVNKFLIRGAPEPLANSAATPGSGTTFVDATNAVVNVRAKLLQPLSTPGVAQKMTIYARDRQGNDNAVDKGADEWIKEIDLSQFNTSTMTTVSIPLSSFTLNANASTLGRPPLGFANAGTGLLTNFGLYEFGGLVQPASMAGGGLLKLEMEYMEIRLPSQALAGDYNGDGFVNAADYTIWQDTKGSTTDLRANGDNTGASAGVIDNADFLFWKGHFTTPGSGGVATGVPEPTTLVLAAIALGGAIGLRKRRS